MSWFSRSAVAGKQGGLFLRKASGSAPPSPFTLRPTFAAMTYAAIYQAAFPAALEIGQAFDPVTAGASATLSDADLSVSFSGVGAVQVNLDIGSNGPAYAFEILVGPTLDAIGLCSEFIFGFNGNNAYGQGNGATSQFLNRDGTWFGFDAPPAVAALVDGDVVGVVSDTNANLYAFWVNGVLAASGGFGAAGNPYKACVSNT